MKEPKTLDELLSKVIKDKTGNTGGALLVCTNSILNNVYNISDKSEISNYSQRGFENITTHLAMVDKDFVAITSSFPGRVKIIIYDDDQRLLSELGLEEQENSIHFNISRTINKDEIIGDKRIISGDIQEGKISEKISAIVSEKGNQNKMVNSLEEIKSSLRREDKKEKNESGILR